MKVTLRRIDQDFHMQAANEDGLTVESDGSPSIGGHNLAMRPMQMVLAALGSCSSIDVIHLLNKQRQPLDHIELDVTGQRAEGQVPAVFTDIHVHYRLYGALDEKKVERACRLSMEKLCSVSKMLEKAVKITWDYEVQAERPA
ncbi:MAG: OsmC family protein [Lewinella sp.]|nr:OsmC family protein [Lewinella sp.]